MFSTTGLLLATLLWTDTLCAANVLSKGVLHELCQVLIVLPKSLIPVRQACVKSQLCIAAMILERIVGRDVSKPISSKQFHDIHYLRQMLFCVFSALHQAQKKLAFHHADLRLPNIMEVVPDAHTIAASTTDPPRAGTIQEAAQFEAEHIPTTSGLTGNLSSATPIDARMQPLAGTQSGVGLMGSHGAGHPSIKPYSSDLAGLQTEASRAAHFKVSNMLGMQTNASQLLPCHAQI